MMRGYGAISTGLPGWMEKERPACGPLDAVLRPRIVAPCTSDVHSMHGGAGPQQNRILGHEAIGEVVEVGALVTRFKPGDLVVVPCCTPDWMAPNIQELRYNAHDRGPLASFKFLSSKDGVFAEFFHVNQADANLAHLPSDISPEAALMTVDMMSTGFHAAELAEISFGDRVVVIGIGPVGLMAVAAASLRGAGQIIAVGSRPTCVRLAEEYGATEVLNYKEGDLIQRVKKSTGGGADRVILAGGSAETFAYAVAMLRPMGILANVNYFDASEKLSLPAPLWGLGMANKDIRGGFCPGGARRVERLMELIRHGRVDPSKLLTHKFYGFERVEDAFLLMERKAPELIKPVVYID